MCLKFENYFESNFEMVETTIEIVIPDAISIKAKGKIRSSVAF
jgi:hypothetical protein